MKSSVLKPKPVKIMAAKKKPASASRHFLDFTFEEKAGSDSPVAKPPSARDVKP